MAPATTNDDDDHNLNETLPYHSENENNYNNQQQQYFSASVNNNISKSTNVQKEESKQTGHCVSSRRKSSCDNLQKSTSKKSRIYDPNKITYGTTTKVVAAATAAVAATIENGIARKGSIGEIAKCNRAIRGNNGDTESGREEGRVGVSDIIGSLGWFQMLVLIFSGLREGLVGYDALVMSIILQPEDKFLCADNLKATHKLELPPHDDELLFKKHGHMNLANFSTLFPNGQFNGPVNETAQCFRSSNNGQSFIIDPKTNQPSLCESWIFSNESSGGPSLVAEWELVCQYHWLVAFIESAYFFGLVTGNLVWGYYADKVGRRPAYLAAHTISLVFGSLAVVSPTIYTFAFCRYLSAFGSIGYNIIYSIQVELIGVKHRSFCTIMNHLGWGLGVIFVPIVDHLFDDYRPIIAVAPVLTLLMFPWAFWLPESSRWLMANDKYKDARRELLRAAKFNGKQMSAQLEKRIQILMQQSQLDRLKQQQQQQQQQCKELIIGNDSYDFHIKSQLTGNNNSKQQQNAIQSSNQKREQVCSYRLIFSNSQLLRDTIILSYVAFVGHLFYYVQTINFAYVKNLSTTANFITSGAGEWVSVLVGAILLKLFSRKTCMSLFLFFMTCSFSVQSFIDSGIMPELDTKLIITANNGIGTLASLLLVFVALIVNQEVYPTIVRQTGTSLTNTLGESGSTLAPLIIQFSRIIGSWRANVIYSIFCLFGILAAQFVSKTDDIELPDT